MDLNKLKKIKRSCYELLFATTDIEIADAAMIYLTYGINTNDKADVIRDLDPETRSQIFYNATHGWVKYLDEEIGRPVVFDFDLWADSLNFTRSLLEALGFDLNTNTSLQETC